jgi:hypothetical protein
MSRQAQPRRQREDYSPQPVIHGRDEMNLAEFPIGKLGVRDKRETLTYEGWLTDKQGNRYRQKWVVSGSKQYGLPHELGNRMLVAFITLAAELQSKEVPFTDYQMLRLLRLSDGKANYRHFERNLLQLAGLTIYSEQAFWDNEQKRHLTTKRAFHIFEDVWLSSWHEDDEGKPRGQGYVVFSDVFWGNIQSGYLKSLDLELYLGTLRSSLARQLYRCLDKFMRYRSEFETDIFDLANRIGMRQYRYPSKIREKLQPAIRELIATGFLARASFRRVGHYTRVRFVKPAAQLTPPVDETVGPGEATANRPEQPQVDEGREWLKARYGISEEHQGLWDKVLAELGAQMPTATFISFVEPTVLLDIRDGVATVGTRNPLALSWLQARMTKRFRDELNYHRRAAQQELVTTVTVVALGEEGA